MQQKKCKKHNFVQKCIQSFYSMQERIKVIIECLRTLTYTPVCVFENMYESATSSLCGQEEVIALGVDFWLEETFGL